MFDDILPPWQVKTKITKKRAATPVNPAHLLHPLAGLHKPEPAPAKKVSLSNLRSNIHPRHWYDLSRQEQWVLLTGLILVFLATLSSCYFLVFKVYKQPVVANLPPPVKAIPKPITVAAALTGLQIDPALAKRPVTGIMVENSPDARPQSGLQDAGVVYEAIAEGGITRFLALFQDTQPQYIGPVRSLRPYYLDWAVPFDASIAHVGGSPEALAQIRSGMKDLDQFFNAGSYWRQPSRPAPHNVYTSFQKLDALNQAKGYIASSPQGWEHKTDKVLAVPTAKSININISSTLYNVHYDYDPSTNSYLRSEGGKPHLIISAPDDRAGQQLHPKVVIALAIPYSVVDRSGHSGYASTGGGSAFIFQDGGVINATWAKADRPNQFSFKDAKGQAVKLDAGQAWLTAIGSAAMVNYSP